MGYVIRMPQMGMSMEQGTVVEWHADEGAEIESGSVVVIVESEKASNEVEAREDGVLRAVLVPEGGAVEPGTAIGIVAGPDETLAAYEDQIDGDLGDARAETGGAPDDRGSVEEDPGTTAPVASAGASGEGRSSESGDGAAGADVRASPGARRLATEEGVDLTRVEGTGPQGVVTDDDVAAHVDAGGDGAGTGGAARTVAETRSLSSVQRAVGERLGESEANAVHVTLNRSIDAGALGETVSAVRAAEGTEDVSITDLLLKAVADALTAHPEVNALFEEGEHRLVDEVNVGVAVDVEEGLLTPVVASVDERSAEEVGRARSELIERARSGEFDTDDLSGGTFTVSNLGPFGVDDFDPIINPPEIAILGVGRIRDDGEMTLSLSFDHRVLNGVDAARFLDTLSERLTDAATLAGYFDGSPSTPATPDEREVRAETAEGFAGRYRTARGSVAFDEPESVGGTGSAPSPVDHLLGALGSCLSLAVREQARRDGIDLGAVETTVTGSPDRGALEAVDVELELATDADADAVEKVVTKGERACYVARTLSDDLSVSVEWTRGADG